MSKRVYNFQDILYVKYEDTDDTLSIDMTEEYKKENAPYNLLDAVAVYNEVGSVVQKGYVYNKENLITYTTGFIFRNFKQTVEDAIDNKSGWSMALLCKKFEVSFFVLIGNIWRKMYRVSLLLGTYYSYMWLLYRRIKSNRKNF